MILEIDGELDAKATGDLSYLIPNSIKWRGLSYGQGEGEVEMLGCIWGLYFSSPHRLTLVLHEGTVDLDEATSVARMIAAKAFRPSSYSIRLAPDETDN